MLGIGGIEILEASYSLGMCGHIIVEVNETHQQYRVRHTMLDGWQVSRRTNQTGEWSQARRMQADEFIALLPCDHGMSYPIFIALWAGFAAGYEKGQQHERIRWRENTKQTKKENNDKITASVS